MYYQVLRFSGVYLIARLVWQPVLLHVVPHCPCSLSHSEGSQDEAISATVMVPQSCRALAGEAACENWTKALSPL